MFTGSWKTTSAGILLIVGAITTLVFTGLTEASIMAATTAILAGVGMLFARDNNVTSEQVNAAGRATIVEPVDKAKAAGGSLPVAIGFLLFTTLATGYTHNAQAQTRSPAWTVDFPEVITGVVRAVDAPDGGTTFEVFAGQGFGASYSYVQYDPADSLWKTIVGVGPVIYCRKLSGEAWEFNPGIKVKGAEVWLFPFEPSFAVTYQVGSLPDGISRVNVWLDQDLLALFNALF